MQAISSPSIKHIPKFLIKTKTLSRVKKISGLYLRQPISKDIQKNGPRIKRMIAYLKNFPRKNKILQNLLILNYRY